MTHEALTLPGEHIIQATSPIDQPMTFIRHQARVSPLGVGKHKTPHLIIPLSCLCDCHCIQRWFSLLSLMSATSSALPNLFSLEKIYEWMANLNREVGSS